MKTALVLSAGGMYGAYQAGAWQALADVLRPDLIVGASIGALNGWAIAGGCDPGELVERWLNLEEAGRYRWRAPRNIFHGVLDSGPLLGVVREIHGRFEPQTGYALVVTELRKLRPRIIQGPDVTWRHLAASIAIAGLFDQVRLDGKVCSDGGLLAALPVWAAVELGASRIVAIDVLPEPPGLVARGFVRAVQSISPFRPAVPAGLDIVRLAPKRLLGSPREMLYWKRETAEAWIAQGRREAEIIKHSIANCFERE